MHNAQNRTEIDGDGDIYIDKQKVTCRVKLEGFIFVCLNMHLDFISAHLNGTVNGGCNTSQTIMYHQTKTNLYV